MHLRFYQIQWMTKTKRFYKDDVDYGKMTNTAIAKKLNINGVTVGRQLNKMKNEKNLFNTVFFSLSKSICIERVE